MEEIRTFLDCLTLQKSFGTTPGAGIFSERTLGVLKSESFLLVRGFQSSFYTQQILQNQFNLKAIVTEKMQISQLRREKKKKRRSLQEGILVTLLSLFNFVVV